MTNVPARHVVVPAARVKERGGIVSFLSNATRRGRWSVPRHLRVAAIAGNVELDLREAEIADGVTEIEVMAVFGNCEIVLPSGVRVECTGDALVGSFELRLGGDVVASGDAPVIRIRGHAYFANVETSVQRPGLIERWLESRRHGRTDGA